jgi:cyclopropane-fatty-acyl-phospholipid synthase
MFPESLSDASVRLIETGLVPEVLESCAIRSLCAKRLYSEKRNEASSLRSLLQGLQSKELAIETEAANEQHYEIPAKFYDLCLGKHKKYSSCYFPNAYMSLSQAEEASLKQVLERAQLEDGQDILELGCGWGSLTLFMAESFPNSQIIGVSNSNSQREYIESAAKERGLSNIEIRTRDINVFDPEKSFDRVVSIEMMEHVRNHRALFSRIEKWLKPEGKLFVHIFSHRYLAYTFETDGPLNWMGRYFFTGGVMPSAPLFLALSDNLITEDYWWLKGTHYSRTADAWLKNLERNKEEVLRIFKDVYSDPELRFQHNRCPFLYPSKQRTYLTSATEP